MHHVRITHTGLVIGFVLAFAVVVCAQDDTPVEKAKRAVVRVVSYDAEGKVLFLSDGNCEFTKEIGMEFDGSGIGLDTRSKRYAMLVEDGVVKELNTEDSPGVADVSSAAALLEAL